ncbi:MAG: hypothetical protein ISP01_05660 [Methanobrevibacter arboriphilus]|uniref:Uncharacterized protein n=2 Tax=Methanobrevibacter arboriphilus TaxID=39441 RepID=A0A843AII9_METAZ|nr:hypothetical protein [Methanobrevibacter arboriphilus]MBF4468875.1 hypothetical protein [Methanobrevibacter arboriphilus]
MKINKKIILIIILIIIISIGTIHLLNNNNSGFASGNGSGTSNTITSNIEKQFNDGEKIENLKNFNEMTFNEKNGYVTKLASSKGYGNFYHYIDNGYEVWYASNDSYVPEKAILVIIQNKTGNVVIYNVPIPN